MTIALWCILAAGVMPYLLTAIAKTSGSRFDNRDPRSWQAKLTGLPARAHSAHLNSFEAFPLFAAAVLIAEFLDAPQPRVDNLALAFIALRIGFAVCYLAGWATLRSIIWALAFACCIALFFVAA